MPPKRKLKSAAVDTAIATDVPTDSVISLPPGVKITWQLEDRVKDTWVVYNEEVQDALTAAAMSGKKQLNLTAGTRSALTVDLLNMMQSSKGAEKRVRGLVESKNENLSSWEVKQGDGWKPLQVGVAAKLEQVVDISSNVVIGGIKYDLVNMCTEDKMEIKREKQAVKNFLKSSITGNIKVAEKQDDEEEVEKPSKKAKVKSTKSIKNDPEEVEESKPVMKSIMLKGLAPVDTECPFLSGYHVYCEGKEIWDVMLNQTNIQNNNNKYYLIQLLEADKGGSFAVWMRWGRVGYKGQTNWTTYGPDKDKAKVVFKKKFSDKTYNQWEEKDEFEKHSGKYDMVKMDYSAGSNTVTSTDEVDSALPVKKESSKSVTESTLPKSVQDLISLICDIQTMEQAVMEMEYDTKKAPLGKVTTEQISAGYQSLKKISECITRGKTSGPEIIQACNDFYTRIPHEFGFRTPPIIRTSEMVKTKLQLLEALSDIQVALKILSSVEDEGLHPVDRRYKQLDVDIAPLDRKSKQFKMVEHSIKSTHASTHSQYSMEVMEMFSLDKANESSKYEDYGNTKLLYHGSRLSNWAGILSQGLRIAPPEAPCTGYMFGKGVYFADMSSKSANYCFTNRSQPVGLLLLCEVSLGNTNKLVAADYEADKLPPGAQSVHGMGKIEPSEYKKMEDGLELPVGPPKDTKVVNKKGYTLQYNEFIVYDTKQIKMKYLAKIKFNYNM